MIKSNTINKLVWNVYTEDWNSNQIEIHNIFDHGRFWEDCIKAKKKFKDDRDGFLEQIKKDLMYYYWSKCEWEIILSDWPPSETFKKEKIDVYDQVMMNWDIFAEYIWNNKDKLKKTKIKY